MYTPDNWKIICIQPDNLLKVLAGWSGGYLEGDSWRMNSGITEITEDEVFYYAHGHSGSVYKLHKGGERFSMVTYGIFERMKNDDTVRNTVDTISIDEAIEMIEHGVNS
jgi:hypothetical protein